MGEKRNASKSDTYLIGNEKVRGGHTDGPLPSNDRGNRQQNYFIHLKMRRGYTDTQQGDLSIYTRSSGKNYSLIFL
jgi:hypothetical protein